MPTPSPPRTLLLQDDEARLLEAVWTDDMPPKLTLRSGRVRVWLPSDEAERLRRWLNAGGRSKPRHCDPGGRRGGGSGGGS